MKNIFLLVAVFAATIAGAQQRVFRSAQTPEQAQFSAVWEGNGFVITNRSGETLDADWEIWVNGLPRVTPQGADAAVMVEDAGGTLSKLRPTAFYQPVLPDGELQIEWNSTYTQRSNIAIPEGMFIVRDGKVTPIPVTAKTIIRSPNNGRLEWERNAEVAPYRITQKDIIPTPKLVTAGAGTTVFGPRVGVSFIDEFAGEADFLIRGLQGVGAAIMPYGYAGRDCFAVSLRKDDSVQDREGYRIDITDGGLTISASASAGAFYGVQSVLSMVRGRSLPVVLDRMVIEDWPDFGFRGQHFDTARNYTDIRGLRRIVDLMAAYKLNVFHFHFSDDEGWRLEIPGLPELTEVGARRGYTVDERDMIVPAYGGQGTGHLARRQFIEFLRYAKARHIRVIPEIESPGHARAAVRAMEARYFKYRDTNREKAEEFLLSEFEDKSVYKSIQDFDDNVMNVALPGTYRFMERVVDEIVKMYAAADAPLEVIHVGGDEVPRGVWSASPAAKRFMRENGLRNTVELADYYVLRVNDILKARGLKIAGWQELVEGRSAKFRAAVKDNVGYVNVWSTNGAQAETPYRLVNQGYPVVLSNVGSLYFDLAYCDHPDERGQFWGGFIDAQRPFAMQPFDVYASLWRGDDGRLMDNSKAGVGKVHADNSAAEALILGMQGQLWAETIRDFDTATRFLLPKLPGLAERAWNSRPEWRSGDDFLRDWSRYMGIVAQKEMPWWSAQGIAYRLPPPGVYIEGGMLYCNSMISGAQIRYSVDGSVPTEGSPLWSGPVPCNAQWVEAKIFYLGQQSVSSAWDNRVNPVMQ